MTYSIVALSSSADAMIATAVQWEEPIMAKIDSRWPAK